VPGHSMQVAILTLWVRKNNSDLFCCGCQAPDSRRLGQSTQSLAVQSGGTEEPEAANPCLRLTPSIVLAVHSSR
jgi:hypothetical protein